MSSIKKLANQTVWYGISNVGARMLNFLLTPLLTFLLNDSKGLVEYGGMSLLYAWIAVANILFTYGMETAYFRFSNQSNLSKRDLFNTTFTSILCSTIFLGAALILLRVPIQHFLGIDGHPEYITWCAFIIGLDAIAAIPFAKLRQEERPKYYAFVKLSGIIVNIIMVVLLIVLLPKWAANHPDNTIASWILSKDRLGFILFANLVQCIFVLTLLTPIWKSYRLHFNKELWIKLFKYSSPMIIIGLAGMINEVMDRAFLDNYLPFDNNTNKSIIAIYSANYRIAIIISLFIQAFKMAAEPFFFNQYKENNAPVLYAKIMKWFVLTLSIAFLSTALYLDIWQMLFIQGESFRKGIGVVPVLLLANVSLGLYYNLSIWYKLTDKMLIGMYITLFGAALTIIINIVFIPQWGMFATAYSTLISYTSMMILAYWLGRKYYPIPYAVKKIGAYLISMLILFFIKRGIDYCIADWNTLSRTFTSIGTGSLLLFVYLILIINVEKKELQNMPIIGKIIKKRL